ncbi:hypothetical protein CTRI78_v010258 [Colletotrichum trifolii]|uniref:Uncharacterized protein n=1 Tax=Colletotrichum trifolii TaxID=5466 RepID=A0A4R8QND5_COLTR|nr:hypothetical protein CTRI78_v010258 [Colletotrichum trifolii]
MSPYVVDHLTITTIINIVIVVILIFASRLLSTFESRRSPLKPTTTQLTSLFYAAILMASGASAIRCSGTLTYCTGSACLCFADGIAESLDKICRDQGFERSLGPSKTTIGDCCSGA